MINSEFCLEEQKFREILSLFNYERNLALFYFDLLD